MLIVSCPNCDSSLDVTQVVPEPGTNTAITICGACHEAFGYQPHEIVVITFDNEAARAA